MQKFGAAAVAWGCGDLLTQTLEARLKKSRAQLDYQRAFVVGAYGCLWVTPLAAAWYGPRLNGGVELLKRLAPSSQAAIQRWSQPGQHMKMALLQSGLTFAFMAPMFACSYVGWNGVFSQGKGADEIKKDVKAKFVPILVSDALFWPLADFCNFCLAPPKLRFYIMLLEDMIWSAILSVWGNHHDDISHWNRLSETQPVNSFEVISEAFFHSSLSLYTLAALRMLDVDRNGHVDAEELRAFLRSTDVQVDFGDVSKGKAYIDFASLFAYLQANPRSDLSLLVQFRMMDINGDGVVTKLEAAAVIGQERLGNLFEAADANQDGKITFEEFVLHERKMLIQKTEYKPTIGRAHV
eukprot:TRINITY_DN93903_c0_g1_i1.p1 TRINITY_DN93903_c0_g1~~TRINITY_DN93903_c0_g1_i1.p1  ORF type:complete len:359 (+),score=63.05 TRINITY_DN93903_c0_g1_i1:22-1077(+)